jgi:hypothetical protein
MQIIDTAAMPWEQLRVSSRNMRTSRKLLRDGEALPGVRLYALIVKTHAQDEVFTAPRHRHNFSQIRLGVRGQMNFGPGLNCEPGEVGFFPGGAYYGPEEINDAEYLLLQWGPDWVTREQDKQAIEATTPALATTMSMPPIVSAQASIADRRAAPSRTSASHHDAPGPKSSARARNRSGSTPINASRAPRAAATRATFSPMPRAAPVITTLRPASLRRIG